MPIHGRLTADRLTMPWPRILLATLVAGGLMQGVTGMLWTNPLTTQPSFPMIAGFLFFTLLHVLVYRGIYPVLPGQGWVGKGLSLAGGIWVFQYGYFEFFTPFNQYWEPPHLIAYELLLQLVMAIVEGLAIARILWQPQLPA